MNFILTWMWINSTIRRCIGTYCMRFITYGAIIHFEKNILFFYPSLNNNIQLSCLILIIIIQKKYARLKSEDRWCEHNKNDVHLIEQLRLFFLALLCSSQFNVHFRFCSRHSSSLLPACYCKVYYQFTHALDYMLFSFGLAFT